MLLVLVVPKIVPLEYVSTALGVHKCLETSGTTIFQTLAGIVLDTAKGQPSETRAYQLVINAFWVANVFQMAAILGLWYLQAQRKEEGSKEIPRGATLERSLETVEDTAVDRGLLDEMRPLLSSGSSSERGREAPDRRRGKVFAAGYGAVVAFNWTLFLGTAWFKL